MAPKLTPTIIRKLALPIVSPQDRLRRLQEHPKRLPRAHQEHPRGTCGLIFCSFWVFCLPFLYFLLFLIIFVFLWDDVIDSDIAISYYYIMLYFNVIYCPYKHLFFLTGISHRLEVKCPTTIPRGFKRPQDHIMKYSSPPCISLQVSSRGAGGRGPQALGIM